MGQDSTKIDSKEFNEAWKCYHDCIFKCIACALPNNREDCTDILHNVYIRASEGWKGLRNKENAKAWFLKVARTATVDFVRKEKKYLLMEPKSLSDLEKADHTPIDTNINVQEIIKGIPDPWRTFFFMKYSCMYTDREIAKISRLPYDTVRKRLYRYTIQLKGVI